MLAGQQFFQIEWLIFFERGQAAVGVFVVGLDFLGFVFVFGFFVNAQKPLEFDDRAARAQPEFARAHLGLGPQERIAGLIHIGQRGATPRDRPRPDVAAHTVFL